ncbi:hypothetical protein B566_EDAN002406 [Ephemera danica]|nr:hypothetical protein B566_EDAN002406 [Ephemera danica]
MSGEAKLTVYFPDVPAVGEYWVLGTDYVNYSVVWACEDAPSGGSTYPAVGEYWVLGTDYVNYSVVWACEDAPSGGSTYQTSWVLTRSRNPSQQVLDDIQAVIDANQLVDDQWIITDQSNCPLSAN